MLSLFLTIGIRTRSLSKSQSSVEVWIEMNLLSRVCVCVCMCVCVSVCVGPMWKPITYYLKQFTNSSYLISANADQRFIMNALHTTV